MVDASMRGRRDRRLGVISDAEARYLDHGEIVGAVADAIVSSRPMPSRAVRSSKVASLPSRPRIGSPTTPSSVPSSRRQRIAAVLLEADHVGDALGEQRKSARDKAGERAVLRMVRTRVRPPGVSVMRSAITLSTAATGRPLSRATRSRSAGSNAISPRIARSVMAATCGLEPGEIGQFVDAFLPDHGGIHVGDKSFLRRGPVRCTTRRSGRRRSPRAGDR